MKFAKKLVPLSLAAAALLCFSACSKDTAIKTAQDLNGKRIGVREGTTGEKWVTANLPKANVNTYRVIADAAVDLSRDVIDAVVVGEMNAREIVSEHQDLKILESAGSFFREEYGIAVRKGDSELLGAVNAAITKAKSTGAYDVIYSSFIGSGGGKNIRIPSFDVPLGERTIRLGTSPGFPPFGYVEGNEIVGFDISLAQLIAREYGANLRVFGMVFRDLIPALADGKIDLIAAAMTITEERKQTVDFSDSYFTTEQVIVVKK